MGLKKKSHIVEAVLFFNEQGVISKQMMFTEFEAMLDGVVNIGEFAGQPQRAAFVLISPGLQIKALVCFYLGFDEEGAPDRSWNIPLQTLADQAGLGPDLGAGAIRLATKNSCPLPSFQHLLWVPEQTAACDDFARLAEAVARNTLGLLVDEEPRSNAPAQVSSDEGQLRSEREQRMKNAELLKQQRQLFNTINQQHEEEQARLREVIQQQAQTLQARVAGLQLNLDQRQAENAALQQQIAELQTRLTAQTASFQAARQEMGDQLRSLEQDARREVQQQRAAFEHELQVSLSKVLEQHKEQISIRDVEIAYLHQQDGFNQQEIKRLVENNAEQAVEGNLRYLQNLNELGLMFMAYHPGVGHLTIAWQDIALYQSNPMAYAASKCFVSEEQYRLWVEHYQQPVCTAVLFNGARCAIPLDRIDVPGRFVAGDSNCCPRHKASVRMRSPA